jgi:hypothetical protein
MILNDQLLDHKPVTMHEIRVRDGVDKDGKPIQFPLCCRRLSAIQFVRTNIHRHYGVPAV